jgi:Holliday junction resolvasome RuvABC endonuclease subunit
VRAALSAERKKTDATDALGLAHYHAHGRSEFANVRCVHSRDFNGTRSLQL